MTTSSVTIAVDAEAAEAYASASEEERRRIDFLLNQRLRELVSPVAEVPRGQDRLATLRQACGIWRDRDDLPDPEELRRGWDRF
jgi:hypothetical protein